jgi:dGTPase
MNIRETTENIEKMVLAPDWATLSVNSLGREREEPQDAMRPVFQRDRDRIIHCNSFRRLKQKTQVFLAPEGDMYRTRLTHTLEVAQIARSIARALRLNEDLTEAIALGHDLGHTPFGHAGEAVLNKLYAPGFAHYEQSVRVVSKIERDGLGLNLTKEVLDGIVNHTKGEWAHTPEGCVVRFADQIAFVSHDIEDAVRAGVLRDSEIPQEVNAVLGDTKSQRITTMVMSIVSNSSRETGIRMDAKTHAAFIKLRTFMYDNVYTNPTAKSEEVKVEKMLEDMYETFLKTPALLPDLYRMIASSEGVERAVVDYISGMTDGFAIRTYTDMYIPKAWSVL